jgi:hypothetical protein
LTPLPSFTPLASYTSVDTPTLTPTLFFIPPSLTALPTYTAYPTLTPYATIDPELDIDIGPVFGLLDGLGGGETTTAGCMQSVYFAVPKLTVNALLEVLNFVFRGYRLATDIGLGASYLLICMNGYSVDFTIGGYDYTFIVVGILGFLVFRIAISFKERMEESV